MNVLESLQQMMEELGENSAYQGYWYSISEALIIMVISRVLVQHQRSTNHHGMRDAVQLAMYQRYL